MVQETPLTDVNRASSLEGQRAGNLVAVAQGALRKKLFSGRLAAGDRIKEAELARELSMSRAPIREALRMLEQTGLVVKTPNRSYVVVTLTEHDIFELSTLRVALESLAAHLAFGRAGLISGMQAALADIRIGVADNDRESVMASDRAFHQAIINAADHHRLAEMYATLSDQIQLAFIAYSKRLPDLSRIVENHERLLDCALNGTADDLSEFLTAHIQTASGVMRNAL